MPYIDRMKILSFSFSAVARIGVPPGKWFCLARTGLGYKQYSCCVCGLHNDVFHKHWRDTDASGRDWNERLNSAIDATLEELGYSAHNGEDAKTMKGRMFKSLRDRDSYLVSPAFSKLIADTPHRVRILTDGPACLVNLVFPNLNPDQVITNKSLIEPSELSGISDVHVGSSLRDLSVPQTRFIINRSIKDKFENVHVFPRLNDDVMHKILDA